MSEPVYFQTPPAKEVARRFLLGYDLVLFDTPTAILLSDPVLLASHLDGLLVVVGVERVNRDLPGQSRQRMQGTGGGYARVAGESSQP